MYGFLGALWDFSLMSQQFHLQTSAMFCHSDMDVFLRPPGDTSQTSSVEQRLPLNARLIYDWQLHDFRYDQRLMKASLVGSELLVTVPAPCFFQISKVGF